jgi:subfamily B ATP-binding cassette protein MsbA
MTVRLPFRRIDPRISGEFKAQRATIVKGLACSAMSAVLLSASAWLVKFILDAVNRGELAKLGWLSLCVMGLFGAKYWFTRGQSYYLGKAATRMTSDLRIRLFEKLQRLPVSYFNQRRGGEIQSVLTSDVGVYQNAMTVVKDSIDGPVKLLTGGITIFALQWQLAVISLLALPVLAYVIQRNARKMKAAQAEVQSDLSNLSAMTQEALHGVRVIKAFTAEERMIGTFRSLVESSYQSQIRAIRRLATLRPLVELVGACALALVVYLCGGLVASGSLDVASLGAFIMALDVMNQGAKNVGSLTSTYAQVQAAADRIYGQVLDVPESHEEEMGLVDLVDPVGKIEFRNVSFTYPDGTQALHDVSFVIPAGTSLALVGPSGAGKSTIADLLLRFYDPTEGQILIDDIDARTIRPASLRKHIGVVPQQTFLFAGTIKQNLRLGAPDATDDELVHAAIAANAHAFINQMPNRYDTTIGERGIRLSGGEAQRIAIARALVLQPEMLLLDEATSNLDAQSEQMIQNALDEIMHTRTTLLIAHRLTTAARADAILMLRAGRVVEEGSHAELLAMGGAYATMYRAFSSGVLDFELG